MTFCVARKSAHRAPGAVILPACCQRQSILRWCAKSLTIRSEASRTMLLEISLQITLFPVQVAAEAEPGARIKWVHSMRAQFSPPEMIGEDGSVRQNFFRPKQVRRCKQWQQVIDAQSIRSRASCCRQVGPEFSALPQKACHNCCRVVDSRWCWSTTRGGAWQSEICYTRWDEESSIPQATSCLSYVQLPYSEALLSSTRALLPQDLYLQQLPIARSVQPAMCIG